MSGWGGLTHYEDTTNLKLSWAISKTDIVKDIMNKFCAAELIFGLIEFGYRY